MYTDQSGVLMGGGNKGGKANVYRSVRRVDGWGYTGGRANVYRSVVYTGHGHIDQLDIGRGTNLCKRVEKGGK